MIRYCYRRILLAVPVMIGISLLAFILGLLSPGDPAEFALNQDGLDAPTDAQIAMMREELGLNRPIYVQYFSWFVQVLHGNFGSSYISGKDILHELLLRLSVTVELALLALAIAAVVGIALGTLCAVYKNSWLDDAVQFLTNILLAVPGFWLALLMILLFSETLRLLPTSGSESLRYFYYAGVGGFLFYIGNSVPLYAQLATDGICFAIFSCSACTWNQQNKAAFLLCIS